MHFGGLPLNLFTASNTHNIHSAARSSNKSTENNNDNSDWQGPQTRCTGAAIALRAVSRRAVHDRPRGIRFTSRDAPDAVYIIILLRTLGRCF